jgi:hypothetical protein
MNPFARTWLRRSAIGMVTAICYIPTIGWAQEFAPFRLTGMEGYFSLRYLLDDFSFGGVSQSRSTYEEELFLLTHSYIYHPNFLKLDLGGGPLFVQNRYESGGERSTANNILYNLTGRLTFLEQKPYPLILFYERLNPSVTLGLAERFIQTNTRYGLNFSLRPPLSPVLLNVEAFRLRSEGSGLQRVVDETIDQATLRAFRSFGPDNYAQISYQWNHQASRSGSPNLPLLQTTTTTHTADFNSRFTFGSYRQFHLTNTASFVTQQEFPSRRDLRIGTDLRWEHSETLRTFYRYTLLTSRVEEVSTTNQTATVGLNHRLYQSLFTTLDLHGEDNRTTGLTLRTYGAAATFNYRKRIPYGSLQLSYAARYDRRDSQATVAQAPVFGERQVLSGTIPVTLANEHVIASTVVVSNAARTQTFVEGNDYRLIVIGTQTQIQRLIAGNILDGETVLVDYAFQTSGTFVHTIFDQNYQANLTLFKHFHLFARYRTAPQRLVSGTPTLPLNSVRSTLYGGSVDLPLWGMVVGGEAVQEDHREEFSPFRRESYDLFIQIPLPLSSSLRVSGRRVLVDNLRTLEDVDLIGGSVVFQSYPWFGARVTSEASYEEDTGGTIPRQTLRGTLRAEWRIRQLILRAEGQHGRERQGEHEREITSVKVELRREF